MKGKKRVRKDLKRLAISSTEKSIPSTRTWYKYPAGTSPGDILLTNNTDLLQNLIATTGI